LQDSRADKTPLELFIAAIQGWEVERGRRVNNDKSTQEWRLRLDFPE
jgi:hypothetical protein